MNRTFGIFCVLVAASLTASSQSQPGGTGLPDNVSGIPISFDADKNAFPAEWTKSPINAKGESLIGSERTRSYANVDKASKKYPANLLKLHLRKVYLLARIEFYGLPYGGTNSLDTLYLTNRGVAQGFTDAYLEESFHHELSSIFLRNHPAFLDQKTWSACNPPKFTYTSNGTEAVRTGKDSTVYDPEYNKDGFLAQYAKTSQEEDFNMMAGGLFTGRPEFWKVVDKFPRIRQKAGVVIAFYHRLDPLFTEPYFRGLVSKDR
jgi:hypothetical protein